MCDPVGDWKEFKRPPRLIMYGQKYVSKLVNPIRKKEEEEWAKGKPKLDNARKMRGIYFIDREDKAYKETIKKMRERSWKRLRKHLCIARASKSYIKLTKNWSEVESIQRGSKDKIRVHSGI